MVSDQEVEQLVRHCSTAVVAMLCYVMCRGHLALREPTLITAEQEQDRDEATRKRLGIQALLIRYAVRPRNAATAAVGMVLVGGLARWTHLGGRHADLVWDTALFTFCVACATLCAEAI